MRPRQPQSRTLLVFVWVMMYAAGAKIGYALFTNGDTLEGAFTQWLMGQLFVYVGGALWSDLPLVWLSSMGLTAALMYSIYFPHPYTRPVAKVSILTLLTLSLFTLWLEPYFTWVGVATELGKQVLLAFMGFVDLGVTFVWLAGAAALVRCINVEFPDAVVTTPEAQANLRRVGRIGAVGLAGAVLLAILGVLTFQAMKQRADDVFQQVADPSAR